MKTLGVNIDHIATLREARRGRLPEPIRAIPILKKAGADSVTAHLREDRRHIQEHDIATILKADILPLNLEISLAMVSVALIQKPQWVCLVPENRKELTTEGGLDLLRNQTPVANAISVLKQAGSKVSLFVDPKAKQIAKAIELKPDAVELHTGSWCNEPSNSSLLEELETSANQLTGAGIKCNAGHGLNYQTTAILAKIEAITEFNIGHFLVGEAIFEGLEMAVAKMKNVITQVN